MSLKIKVFILLPSDFGLFVKQGVAQVRSSRAENTDPQDAGQSPWGRRPWMFEHGIECAVAWGALRQTRIRHGV